MVVGVMSRLCSDKVMVRWVCRMSWDACSMSGVLKEKLCASSGRREWWPGVRSMAFVVELSVGHTSMSVGRGRG